MSIAFVVGTGRCGSKSYAYILNSQDGVKAEHELILCNWYDGWLHIEKNINHLNGIVKYENAYLAVAVGFYFLPYMEDLINQFDVKCVCLKRNKGDTVRSYVSKFKGRNYFEFNYKNRRIPMWNECYPKFADEISLVEGTGLYYDGYYEVSDYLASRYSDNFRIFDMPEVLTEPDYQKESMEFLGVENPITYTNIRLNMLIQKLRRIRWEPSSIAGCWCNKVYI